MLKQGIDISAWQGNIDWSQVKNCIEAVIIRAGYGKNNIDQKWVPNAEAVRDSSLDVGAYWFSYAYTADMAYMEGCSERREEQVRRQTDPDRVRSGV